MTNKYCSKCEVLKSYDLYSKMASSADGFRPSCKTCDSDQRKDYRKRNVDKLAKTQKNYRDKNRDKLIKYHQDWYEKNLKDKGANSDNPEYYKHYRTMVNKTQQERLKVDMAFKMKRNIGRMMKHFFNKGRSTYDIVGCSSDTFQDWIKWQAEIDNIDDYDSNTHMDHVIPCTAFKLDDPIEQLWCFNWSNLRLCPATDNIVKSNTINKDLIKQQEIRALCYLIHNKQKLQTGTICQKYVIRLD